MTYIWNIYEPADPNDYDQEDPYDIFVYSLRKESAPELNAPLYVEGRMCHIIACRIDRAQNEVTVNGDECYYKVAVK